ncbi:MAG TPA: hypothetical protein VHG72_08095, partial [Polyangia bacterium]|nr:hypothetical protein [Polyangia bacterium]
MPRRLARSPLPLWLTCAAGLAVLAASKPVAAQTEAGADRAAQHQQAQSDLAVGRRLLRNGDFEGALVRFQAAYATEPTAAALLGMAQAQRQTDRLGEAYASYEKLLGAAGNDLLPGERDEARAAVAELAALTGTVKVTLSEPDARCAVDDRPLGPDERARAIRLSPGRHVFTANKPGFLPLTFPVWVTAGKELATTLALKSDGSAPPPP